MSKQHDPEKGCAVCQNHATFKPNLGKLKIKHYPEGGRLTAAELEVSWDGVDAKGKNIAALRREFSPAVRLCVDKWGAAKGHDGYGDYGFEACMAPSTGKLRGEQAFDFEDAFTRDGIFVDQDCGGHIHTDARDFCIDDICKLLQIYTFLEPALFKMLPAWRRGIPACEKLGVYYLDYGLDKVKGVQSALTFKAKLDAGDNQHKFGRGPRGNWAERHVGLNVSHWFTLGTVEWRHPTGLLRQVDIVNWSQLFQALMDYSKKTKFFKIKARFGKPTASSTLTQVESFECLGGILEQQAPQLLPFAKHYFSHATAAWNAINKKRLFDLKLDGAAMLGAV